MEIDKEEILKTIGMTGKNRKFSQYIRQPKFVFLFTLLVAFFIGLICINQIVKAILHSRPEISVPSLEGVRINEALTQLSKMNLSLIQDGIEFDESLPAGTILRHHPPAGMKVREGRAIRIIVSKGGQVVFVPDVAGKPLAEAQSALALDELQVGALNEVFSVEYPEGMTISQNPSSGTVVTRGALIDLEVSKGLPPAGTPLLPDFYGQLSEVARDWASGVNARINVREDAQAVGVSGTVVRQDPLPGQPLLKGDELTITVVPLLASNKGARFTYNVPSDRGETQVKILARDNRGESEVYKGTHKGGDVVEIPISINSTTRMRIFLDESLEEEKLIEP